MGDPTAVIFDLDDTLYRERRFAVSGCAAVATHLARTSDLDEGEVYRFLVARHRRGGRATALQALCETYDVPALRIAELIDVIRTHRPRLRLPATSADTLRRLRAQGHRLGVLTNGLPSTQREKVLALGLAPLVDAVVYAETCAPGGKPARRCFDAALGRLGVNPSDAVFVGDSIVNDVDGAKAAGLHTVWLPPRHGDRTASGADAVVATLTEVPAVAAHLLQRRASGAQEKERHVAAC